MELSISIILTIEAVTSIGLRNSIGGVQRYICDVFQILGVVQLFPYKHKIIFMRIFHF